MALAETIIPSHLVTLWNPIPENIIDPNMSPDEIIVTVVGLVLSTIVEIIAALALIFIIIGGFLYMLAGGEQKKMESAKKIVLNSVIGLALAIGAAIILSELAVALGGAGSASTLDSSFTITENVKDLMNLSDDGAEKVVTNIINLLLSVLAMLGVLGITIGSIMYFTSAGNEDRAETGKKTLIYSIIGLAVAIGSQVIVKQIASLLE
ncbi:MAG: hypothetical protein GF347_01830 [Candidatus Moranbacteria bacterium]|nr:hypothetical protein [Candidatus Moranbacteria bacterium]